MTILSSGERDHIAHDEEMFLRVVEELDLDCPLLEKLWEVDFYDSPRIYHTQSSLIVNELKIVDDSLIRSSAANHDKLRWSKAIKRLQKFFTKAVKLESTIETHSD